MSKLTLLLLSLALSIQVQAKEATVVRTRLSVGGRASHSIHAVIGGAPVQPGRYPYLGGLRLERERYTIGTSVLIDDDYVLTAAHMKGPQKQNNPAFVSLNSVYANGKEGEQTAIQQMIPDENYSPISFSRDAMLIKLKQKTNLKPIRLMRPTDPPLQEGDTLTVLGFGLTELDAMEPPLVAHEIQMRVVSLAYCRKYFRDLDPSKFCAGGEMGIDTHFGDSGGPAILHRDGQDILVGHVSLGHPVAKAKGAPTVFNSIAHELNFIYKHVPELNPEYVPTQKKGPFRLW